MKKTYICITIVTLFSLILCTPCMGALNVVTTMPNICDVVEEVGGDLVEVRYVAPPNAVHISSDSIDALLQTNHDFIIGADLFIGHGNQMDKNIINKINDFRKNNANKSTEWQCMVKISKNQVPNQTVVYDNPHDLVGYSETITYILSNADKSNQSQYNSNHQKYITKIAKESELSSDEKKVFSKIPIICQFRLKNQAVKWLGMNCINSYPQPISVKEIIDDIQGNVSKYQSIASNSSVGKIIVIDNSVAGPDMGKGVFEALKDNNIPCERIVFLNLPKSADNINSILDYYKYNKNQILSIANMESNSNKNTLNIVLCISIGLLIGILAVIYYNRRKS